MIKSVKASGSALLVVMTVMTGLTLLLTSWWQVVGWTGDLVLVRQRYITRFYATEIVLNYGVAWVKKEFDSVIKSLVAVPQKPMTLEGGIVNVGEGTGRGTIVIDRVPGDHEVHLKVVRVTATIVIDEKIVSCHRCLVQRDVCDLKGKRFVVSHFKPGINH